MMAFISHDTRVHWSDRFHPMDLFSLVGFGNLRQLVAARDIPEPEIGSPHRLNEYSSGISEEF
jgi:hypothetical protein